MANQPVAGASSFLQKRFVLSPKSRTFVHKNKVTMSYTATAPAQLLVNIDDIALLHKVKNALKLMNGVGKISIVKPKKTGIELAREDVKAGKVTSYDSAQDMFDALMKL